jgi:hypothetical protein
MKSVVAAAPLLLLLAACAAAPPPAGPPQSAQEARAQFDARCAERPPLAVIEQALAEISEPNAIGRIDRRDFERELPWQLQQSPPGTRSAVRGGGKRFGTRSFLGFGPSYVRAAVYLDGENRVLGCRSEVFTQGP